MVWSRSRCWHAGRHRPFYEVESTARVQHSHRGLLIQDWVGKRKTVIGPQFCELELDIDHYAGGTPCAPIWKMLTFVSWVISTYRDPDGYKPWRRNLFQEALSDELVIYKENGEPYFITNTDFDAAMLDLTNWRRRRGSRMPSKMK